jgi:hypothetical protein
VSDHRVAVNHITGLDAILLYKKTTPNTASLLHYFSTKGKQLWSESEDNKEAGFTLPASVSSLGPLYMPVYRLRVMIIVVDDKR